MDCALLNRPEELHSIAQSGVTESLPEGMVGVYLGRSSRRLSRIRLAGFLRRFSARLGKPMCWLPWNHFTGGKLFSRRPRALRSPWVKMESIPHQERLMAGDLFQLMSSFSVIVTDTYHVAINAMCLGIPTLCIYEPAPASDRDANMGYRESSRDKRALLFSSTNQSDLLMPSEDLRSRSRSNKKIEHVAKLIENNAALDHWRSWLSQEREHYREQLDRFIRSRLT